MNELISFTKMLKEMGINNDEIVDLYQQALNNIKRRNEMKENIKPMNYMEAKIYLQDHKDVWLKTSIGSIKAINLRLPIPHYMTTQEFDIMNVKFFKTKAECISYHKEPWYTLSETLQILKDNPDKIFYNKHFCYGVGVGDNRFVFRFFEFDKEGKFVFKNDTPEQALLLRDLDVEWYEYIPPVKKRAKLFWDEVRKIVSSEIDGNVYRQAFINADGDWERITLTAKEKHIFGIHSNFLPHNLLMEIVRKEEIVFEYEEK